MRRSEGLNFLEIFAVITVLGVLSIVAAPQLTQLLHTGKTEAHDSELHNIQTAVILMLKDSKSGELIEAGPTADMGAVRTSDIPPLRLSDYLTGLDGTLVKSGRSYKFTASGRVLQVKS